MSDLLMVLACGLGGWRLASLLVNEAGPWEVFLRVRDLAGLPRGAGEVPAGLIPGILACIWCASVWTTTALVALWLVSPWFALVPAAWAVALIADRASR